MSGWGSSIPTEPTAVWPRGMERDGEGKWHRGVPAAMQAARHSPGNISQAVLFPQLLPFLSPSGKGLTGHSRNTRKILLRGCKFLAVLWSAEPLREKGPKCSQREQLLSVPSWSSPGLGGRAGRGTATGGLGPRYRPGLLVLGIDGEDGKKHAQLLFNCFTASHSREEGTARQ